MSVAIQRGGGNSGAPVPDLLARTSQAPYQNGNECLQCKKKFGIFAWRHHCRCCGASVCSGCSPTFIEGVPGYSGSERVCNICVANQFLYMVVSHQGVFTGYKQHYYSNLSTARSVYTRIDPSCSRVLMHVGSARIVDSWFARASWEESVMGKAFAYRESLMYPQPAISWLADIPMSGGRNAAAGGAAASSSSSIINNAAVPATTTTSSSRTTTPGTMPGITEWYATCVVWRLREANILSHAYTLSSGVSTIKEGADNAAFIAICNNTRTPTARDAIEQVGSTSSSKTGIANHISSGYRVVIVAIHRQRKEVSGLFTFRYEVYDSLTEAYQVFDSISSWAGASSFGSVVRDGRPLPSQATTNSSRENENSDEWCLQMVDVSTCDTIAAKGSRKMGDVNRSPNIIFSIVNAFSTLPRMTQSGIYIACTMLADEVIVSSEGWAAFFVGVPAHKKKVRLEGEERRVALAASSSSSSAVLATSGARANSSSSSSYTEAIVVEQTIERFCKQVGSPSAARNSFFEHGGCIFILPRGAEEPFVFRRHPKLSNLELRQLTELATDVAIRHQIDESTATNRNGGGQWHGGSGGPPNYPPPTPFNTTTANNGNNNAAAAMASSGGGGSNNSSPIQPPPTPEQQQQPLWSSRGAAYVTRNDPPTPTTPASPTPTTPQSTTSNSGATTTPAAATVVPQAPPSSPPPQQQQLPECQICMDVFNSSTRKPCLCGNCGNSLCLECIHSCTSCPLCREAFPDFTVKRPMTNVQLLQLVQEIEDRTK